MTPDDVAAIIRGYRFSYTNEADLQEGIALALEQRGHLVRREVRLTRGERLDLLVEGIGIEVKVSGNMRPLEAQVTRYLRLEEIAGMVIVTTRVRHLRVPPMVAGKPVQVVTLASAGL